MICPLALSNPAADPAYPGTGPQCLRDDCAWFLSALTRRECAILTLALAMAQRAEIDRLQFNRAFPGPTQPPASPRSSTRPPQQPPTTH